MDYSKEQPGQPGWRNFFTRRLQAEGRWKEAQQRKVVLARANSHVRVGNNSYRPSREDKDKAWEQIHREYPPLGEVAEGVGSVVGTAAPATDQGVAPAEPAAAVEEAPAVHNDSPPPYRSRADLKRDVQWVYDHFVRIEEGVIGPDQAPGPGAWGYALWAKSNKTKFFSDVVPKALKLEDDAETKGRTDDEREQFKLLDIFEREEKEARAAREAELAVGEVGPEE